MPLPDRIAGVPNYLPSNSSLPFADAAPGHRFLMYFRDWQGNKEHFFESYKGKVKSSLRVDQRATPAERQVQKAAKRLEEEALKAHFDDVPGQACKFNNSALKQLDALRDRQKTMLSAFGDKGHTLPAISTAPFATGLGNEHPIENGFAFLTPYGLPYLAGSGVKGVLRRAAEELALFADEYAPLPHPHPLPGGEGETPLPSPAGGRGAGGEGLTLHDVWWLFGFEGAQSKQGPAAAIFDRASASGRAFEQALPTIAARDDLYDFIRMALADDRKTRAYYLDQQVDHRLAFLSRLLTDNTFRQSIHTRGALDFWDVFPAPAGNKLVVEIMTPHHAGYYMNGKPPHDAESPTPVPFLAVPTQSTFDFHVVCASDRLPESLRAGWNPMLQQVFRHAFDWLGFGTKTAVGYGAMNPVAATPVTAGRGTRNPPARADTVAAEVVWPAAKLTLNSGTGEIKAAFEGKTTAGLKGKSAQDLQNALGERANKFKKDKELKNVPVRVRQEGNLIVLIGVEPAKA